MQLCGSLSILWHCLSLGLEWKLTFSSPVRAKQTRMFTEAFFLIMKNYESTYLRLRKWLNKSMACWYSILFWNFSTDKYNHSLSSTKDPGTVPCTQLTQEILGRSLIQHSTTLRMEQHFPSLRGVVKTECASAKAQVLLEKRGGGNGLPWRAQSTQAASGRAKIWPKVSGASHGGRRAVPTGASRGSLVLLCFLP